MKYAIGIDLGGTSIKYALIDDAGNFLTDGKIPSYANISSQRIIEQLFSAIATVRNYAKENRISICGIGIGTPGIVDEGVILGGAENLAGWENIKLAEIIKSETGLEVFIDNDANVMGLAETEFGAAKGCSDVIFLTVGTGIGGAIIVDNKLYGGYKNRGTELGHVPYIANGKPCACGSVGCLETYASASAMIRQYVEKLDKNGISYNGTIDGEYIIGKYHEGEPLAIEVIEENCNILGHAIAGFVNIFSPQKVVIGGGLADAGDFYIDKIRKNMQKYAIAECAVNTFIEKAVLGNKAGCLGAAGLVFSKR